MATPTSDRQRQLFALFLLALLAAGKVLDPCLDWDSWWHLRVGQYIVDKHEFPNPDPFSQIGREEHTPWVAYSWLYELLLYGSLQSGGYDGVLFLRNLLVMVSWGGMAWFFLRHARSGWVGIGVLALATVSLRPFSPERPWHFTILFTTLTLHAVICVRAGARPRLFAGLPLVYALWANIHIQFVMGFAVLGLGWLVTAVEWLRTRDAAKGRQARALFLLGAACTAATLVTPFHYRLYFVIWEYATQTKALRLVMELQPPDLAKWYNWPLIALAVAAAVRTAVRGYRLWDLVLLGSALFFSLRMQRDLWYGILTAGAVVVGSDDEAGPAEHSRRVAGWQIGAAALLALLLVRLAWVAGLSNGKTPESCHAEMYPVGAANYVREKQLPGPLFNDFNWGGYLIWALPELPVSIDGRTNLYGEKRLERSMATWRAEPGWEDDPDLRRARIIIAPLKHGDEDVPLTKALRERSDRWRIVYEDKTSAVFVPVTAP
jgi:hypothetical protein